MGSGPTGHRPLASRGPSLPEAPTLWFCGSLNLQKPSPRPANQPRTPLLPFWGLIFAACRALLSQRHRSEPTGNIGVGGWLSGLSVAISGRHSLQQASFTPLSGH